MYQWLEKIFQDENAATSVEYVALIALITGIIIFSIGIFGGLVTQLFQKTTTDFSAVGLPSK
jgi:Flp pilus assembly pilin Flp